MTPFSILVFAKNEEANLPFVTDRLLEHYAADKILFVLDGNVAPSAGILCDRKIRFLRGTGQGKGAAIRMAIREVESDILVFMDADGSHDPAEIKDLLAPMAGSQVALVIGSRFLGSSEEFHGNVSDKIRYLGNVTGNVIINRLWNRTGRKITNAQDGFRSVRRSIFLTLGLEENGFSIEQEMVIRCLKKGYDIREVPSREGKRVSGRSHISPLHFFCYVGCLIRNWVC